jgi:hypothetical protein
MVCRVERYTILVGKIEIPLGDLRVGTDRKRILKCIWKMGFVVLDWIILSKA